MDVSGKAVLRLNQAIPEAALFGTAQENRSTQTAGALYQAFAPAEAERILRRLELHYTPKHASWLNMVWSRSRSACSAASASIAESTIPTASSTKLPHGKNNETSPVPASIGCSQPKKIAPTWAGPIPSHPNG